MKSNEEKIYSYLGLATRAGKIVSGDDSTLLELKRGNVKSFLKIKAHIEMYHTYISQLSYN